MKIVITVISMVLMVRGCCCVANNTNTIVVRASSSNSTSEDNENPLRNVINCFKEDSLFKCFNDRVGLLIRVWRQALLNSVRRNGDQPLQVNQGFENLIKDIGKAVYYGFTSIFYGNFSDDDEARSADDTNPADSTNTNLEERGHKKKKVHKEIKKIVIKIIIAIALFILKIKAILGMIQSVIITKFVLVSLIYIATLTFKIWWEIKKHKHHEHDKSIVYYDNVHHDHTYELPEHSEYDEHGYSPSSWGSLWGRSYMPTQSPVATVTASTAFQNMYRKPWPYYAAVKKPGLGSDEEEYS